MRDEAFRKQASNYYIESRYPPGPPPQYEYEELKNDLDQAWELAIRIEAAPPPSKRAAPRISQDMNQYNLLFNPRPFREFRALSWPHVFLFAFALLFFTVQMALSPLRLAPFASHF
jgi:hypothetical protein